MRPYPSTNLRTRVFFNLVITNVRARLSKGELYLRIIALKALAKARSLLNLQATIDLRSTLEAAVHLMPRLFTTNEP